MAAKERTARLDDDLRTRVETRLAQLDQRFTRKREALVAVLASAARPLTIPEICQHDAELAASSIYRNLTMLEQVGVVHRIVTAGDFAHYELAEDLTERHHHHLVCSNCGAVEDFEAPTKLEQAVRNAEHQIQDRVGFQTERHLVDLIGLCAKLRVTRVSGTSTKRATVVRRRARGKVLDLQGRVEWEGDLAKSRRSA